MAHVEAVQTEASAACLSQGRAAAGGEVSVAYLPGPSG